MDILKREFLPNNSNFVHASTVEIWNEHPVFAWFGGQSEGTSDVSIYLHNLFGKNRTIKMPSDRYPRWNPILFKHNNKLFLFEKAGVFCDSWQTFYYDITEWGEDISPEEILESRQILPAGLNGPVKTRPVLDPQSGNILCGSSVETVYDWVSYIEEYKIKGSIWELVKRSAPLCIKEKKLLRDQRTRDIVVSKGVIQPALWVDSDDEVNLFMRSSHPWKTLYYSSRRANGWSDPMKTNLYNPNSGVDVAFCNGSLYLVYNPNEKYRAPLIISKINKYVSGSFYIREDLIVADIDETAFDNNYSYPYMLEENGILHLVYTYKNKHIEYLTINIEED